MKPRSAGTAPKHGSEPKWSGPSASSIKRAFGFTQVRYRGLKKNHEWLCAGFALANL
jgi:hypothetical protein